MILNLSSIIYNTVYKRTGGFMRLLTLWRKGVGKKNRIITFFIHLLYFKMDRVGLWYILSLAIVSSRIIDHTLKKEKNRL